MQREDEKGGRTMNMAPALRLRQFTPFFPTSISPPSTPATPHPDSAAAAPAPPTPALPLATAAGPDAEEAAAAAQEAGENFGPLLNYTIWMMTGVSFTILALRFYCKLSRDRRLWWDDWVLKLAWVAFPPAPQPPSLPSSLPQTSPNVCFDQGGVANRAGSQLSLVIAAVMTTVSVSYGYGRPLETIEPSDLEKMPALANVAGFFSVWAAMWSKISFALTLARISDGWIRRCVWAIIMTMTAIMGSSAVMVFFDIDTLVKIRYFMFATGELESSTNLFRSARKRERQLTCGGRSVLWSYGPRALDIAVEDHLESEDDEAREDRRAGRHEHGRLVSSVPRPLTLSRS